MNLTDAVSFSPNGYRTADKSSNRIHDAAQQFEALMIAQMMKTARETNSDGWLSDGGETGESSAMDMAESQFAQAIASHGGLGLAKMIVKAVGGANSSSGVANVATIPADAAGAKNSKASLR